MPAPIPDYSKVSLLLPMSGANGGTTFADRSINTKTINNSAGAVTSTAQSKYYGSSGYFDGGTRIYAATHTDFALGTGDFTVSLWFRKSSGSAQTFQRLVQFGNNSTNGILQVFANGGTANEARPYVAGYSGGGITPLPQGASASAQDVWNHLAVCRAGNEWYLWINGGLASQATLAGYSVAQNTVYVGANDVSGNRYTGYIQDVLVVKGQALYTSAFTPPARLIGDIAIETRDESNALVSRKVFAVARSYTSAIAASGTTDGSGALTLSSLPACEYSVAAIDSGDQFNDLVLRRTPV